MDYLKATHDVSHAEKKNLLDDKYYQLTGLMKSRVLWNVPKIKNGILKRCAENHFTENRELMNIASNVTVSPIAGRHC